MAVLDRLFDSKYKLKNCYPVENDRNMINSLIRVPKSSPATGNTRQIRNITHILPIVFDVRCLRQARI